MAEEGIAAGGVMNVNIALQQVLKTALTLDGLAHGIDEAAKTLDKRQAHLCVLAFNCDGPVYVKSVEALCAEHQINLIKVDDNKKLGKWVGLCKIDREGKLCKVVGCSCVVVKDYGKESQAKDVVEEYFKCKKWWNKKLSSCFFFFFNHLCFLRRQWDHQIALLVWLGLGWSWLGLSCISGQWWIG